MKPSITASLRTTAMPLFNFTSISFRATCRYATIYKTCLVALQ